MSGRDASMNNVTKTPTGRFGDRCGLGVVIVNYRTPALTVAAIRSIAPSLRDADARVVVVDNASDDGSVEFLAKEIDALAEKDRILLVSSPENNGFSAGNNLGMQHLDADWRLFLNSDAMAAPGALLALRQFAEQHPDLGVIAPLIADRDGAPVVSRFRNHTPLSEFVDGAETGPITKLFAKSEVPIFPGVEGGQPDWVSFAAVMISRAAVDKVGPMDEGFFLYYEDCDYCRRIQAAGFEIGECDAAVFTHDEGGSTGLSEKEKSAQKLPAYYYRSRARYFRKYYGPAGLILANLGWYAGRVIAKLRGVFGRSAPAVSQGRARDIWTGWKSGPSQSSH